MVVQHELHVGGGGILAQRRREVPARCGEMRDETVLERLDDRVAIQHVGALAQLDVDDRARLEVLALVQGELEALDQRRETLVAVEPVLDVERIDVRAHVGDRRVVPAEEEEERCRPAVGQ